VRICFDLDETLCYGDGYFGLKPFPRAAELLKRIRAEGHTVIIYTARGMGSCNGNVGLATAKMAHLTFEQLEEWGFEYDEIYFGKPAADLYVDDKSIVNIYKLSAHLGYSND